MAQIVGTRLNGRAPAHFIGRMADASPEDLAAVARILAADLEEVIPCDICGHEHSQECDICGHVFTTFLLRARD